MVKTKFATFGFRIYLFKGGGIGQEAKGIVAFLGKGTKQIGQEPFNHWDEVPAAMRKLLKKSRYRKKWNEKRRIWTFEK